MKIIRLIVAALFVTAFASISTFAQTGPSGAAKPNATQTTPANTNVNIPASKIAFIDSRYFTSEKEGITRFITAVKTLEREFQPRQQELDTIGKRIQALKDEIEKLAKSPVVDQKTILAKQEEAESLQRDGEYKQKAAQAAYQKRYGEIVGPIEEDINNFLMAFAKQRGISFLIDLGTENSRNIIPVDASLDVTKTFIAEYNIKNPGTAASTTTPGTGTPRP